MKHQQVRKSRQHGFTLVELLVVIAIIAILVLMLLPAINSAREAARRNGCMGHMAQLGVALSNHHLAHEVYPSGVIDEEGPIANVREGFHHSWIVQLLPYIDQRNTARHIDKTKGAYHEDNLPVARVVSISQLRCPSSWAASRNEKDEAMSDYAGCHHDEESPIDADNHGVMFLNSKIRQRDVTDGLSTTIFVGEKVTDERLDQSWLSGTRGTLRNTGTPINMTPPSEQGAWSPLVEEPDYDDWNYYGDDPVPPSDEEAGGESSPAEDEAAAEDAGAEPAEEMPEEALFVGGFGSHHTQGAMFLFGDGRVVFLTDDIDEDIYRRLGHRADGKLIGSLDEL